MGHAAELDEFVANLRGGGREAEVSIEHEHCEADPFTLDDSTTLLEREWDSEKHPRGGFSQKRGWFSPGSGGNSGRPFADSSAIDGGHSGGEHGSHSPNSPPSRRPVDMVLAQLSAEEERKEQERINRALNNALPTQAPPPQPGDLVGERLWTSKSNTTLKAKLTEISPDGNSVKLDPGGGGTIKTVPVNKLSDDDHQLIDGLRALPPTIKLDTSGLANKNKQSWTEAVIRDCNRI